MYNRGNDLEIKNILLRNEMYKEIFNNKSEEKYIAEGYFELLFVCEKNLKVIQENNETKYLCFKNLNYYKKKYNISDEIRLRINNLIGNFTF